MNSLCKVKNEMQMILFVVIHYNAGVVCQYYITGAAFDAVP